MPFQCQPVNLFLIRTECKPLIEGAVVLPLQLAEAPIVFDRLNFVKMPFLDVVNAHELQIVRPTQVKFSPGADSRKILKLAKHCFANLILGVNLVKLPDIFQVTDGKTFPKVFC